ncbi:DMT family transporter [Paenibacillus sp. SAF-054]|uniref:DMT family transporter n=1 Tax=unclassified Paenibacillus TaxID=185978 RepID=UPI003F7F52D3
MKPYLFLAIAIISELFATSMLKASNGFSKWIPSLCTIVGFGIAFYSLSITLRHIPIGVAYAIWSGIGTALTTIIGIVIWKESANMITAAGLMLILVGVVVINLKGAAH